MMFIPVRMKPARRTAPGATTCALLRRAPQPHGTPSRLARESSLAALARRSLFEDEAVFPAPMREKLLEWATGRRVLPEDGLENTGDDKGLITFSCRWSDPEVDRWSEDTDEEGWPLPKSSTCRHEVTLPAYSRREVRRPAVTEADASAVHKLVTDGQATATAFAPDVPTVDEQAAWHPLEA